ncbi:flap endonuclease GEN [Anopheles darlingi]|uniref:flap endonuclease GEN n=1 Tax=Anopheles darlingi TaxID=43151 RepID=UPI00210051B9|nr:flap endonuclease GEN [Anopheles darlingi]
MGVKDLWNLLTPHMERKPLFELSNKVVAIDLSGWVCESLNVVDYFVHPRFYLRNLFFRTCYLLQTGITPVFVLEGAAPPLKYGVIVKRNQLQFRGVRPKKVANCDKAGATAAAVEKASSKPTEQKRNRFHHVLKQCEELLSAMGLVCVQAPGEAEALCAYLNRDALIDGVISQDSDCFAYGAVRVFRNFCASQNGGSVDVYDLERANSAGLRLGQEKIVAMALLSGCDYCPAGVAGVGREMVTRLLNCYDNQTILQRIRSWRNTAHRLTELEVKVDDKNVCPDCGHIGKLMQHRKAGCLDCHRSIGCDESKWKQQRANVKAELEIKRKALKDPDFPHEPIIEEFMTRPCELPALDLQWKQPNLVKFIRSMSSYLQWNELYCFQKLLPLFTRWQIQSAQNSSSPTQSNIFLTPDYIKKKRSPKGIASYEIVWKDALALFKGLIPQEQIDAYVGEAGNSIESLWSTIEPHELVLNAYPDLVDKFLQSKVKGKRKKAPSKTTSQPQESGSDKPKRKPSTRAKKKDNDKNTQTLYDAFVHKPAELQQEDDACDEKENQANLPNELSPHGIDHLLNFTAELEAIAEDQTANDTFNSSALIERLCRPNYLQLALAEYMELIEMEKRKEALEDLLSNTMPHAHMDVAENEMEQQDGSTVHRRIVLKQDILNASSLVDSNHLDQSLAVSRKTKRKSFFFEPIIVPCDGDAEQPYGSPEMDMFECSLMLKDQIVIEHQATDGNDTANQTIIYDIDF